MIKINYPLRKWIITLFPSCLKSKNIVFGADQLIHMILLILALFCFSYNSIFTPLFNIGEIDAIIPKIFTATVTMYVYVISKLHKNSKILNIELHDTSKLNSELLN